MSNNPLKYIDPSGHENIVISGNSAEGYAARNFIETAKLQIKDWQEEGISDISWLVADDGYTSDQINEIRNLASNYEVQLVLLLSKTDFFNYFSEGRDRSTEKVDEIAIFAHGKPGILALGYDHNDVWNASGLNIGMNDVYNLDSSDFASEIYTTFYLCNAGTIPSGTGMSFARVWANQTGGTS